MSCLHLSSFGYMCILSPFDDDPGSSSLHGSMALSIYRCDIMSHSMAQMFVV